MRGIVTLCGSVRFKELFDKVNKDLTLWGYVVLQPGVWDHKWLHRSEHNAEVTKDGLDKLHCDKILMSDSIVVIDKGGYVGLSTAREIEFARINEKSIYFLNDYKILERRGL